MILYFPIELFYHRKLPAEFQKSFGGVRYTTVRPCQEVELSDGPGLSGFQVLQIKAPYQVIVAPYMFAHQMHLKNVGTPVLGNCILIIFYMINVSILFQTN